MTLPLPMRRLALLAALALGGCDGPGSAGPTTRPASAGPAGGPTATHLEVFLLDVPAGSISGDEQFWRTVDEDAVGVAADQRLLSNGVRCGVAPRAQWQRFAGIFAKELDRARRTRVEAIATQTVELEVEQPVDHEDVFVLDADHHLEGRTYDRATNGIALTFGPAPREPGSIRLSFCPIVKRQERLSGYTSLGQPQETPVADVARLYDVGLTVNVPADGFFLLAPGPNADPDLSLGGRFLLRRDPAARREQIIVAVPKVLSLDTPVPAEE